MIKIYHINLLNIFLILITFVGCTKSQTELNLAQGEIDSRHYHQAIERLEKLARENTDIKKSIHYIDLLTSAYLGGSGFDLIDTLGHWAETYKNFQNLRHEFNSASNNTSTPLTFQEYKAMVDRLVPPEPDKNGTLTLRKAVTLCSEHLNSVTRESADTSKRILIKTMVINFWALLTEIKLNLFPSAEKLLSTDNSKDFCDGIFGSASSFAKAGTFAANIAIAGNLLGEHRSPNIDHLSSLSELTSSLTWLNQYSSCEQLTHDEIEKIKQRLAAH